MPKDWCSEKNATEMANKIQQYWAEKGVKVDARIEVASKCANKSTVFGIRSNLTGTERAMRRTHSDPAKAALCDKR